ncbi:hypothetical protein AYW79_13715 [Ferroacidibacillus organovorans]|uniref:Uncharacterized protein n=1 Tax=Ferroacidibacillus organovorans TaxID=1765683 RepID=A0A853K7Q0_9BACL|nr:hypothetical protein AYJ22_14335 [Ferroacidibacillus organovorans]OAG91383.1 hypothetical protein AYW79_13715 [Ferroacidibacillus organovorans]
MEIPKLRVVWRNRTINPHEDRLVRWLLLLLETAEDDEILSELEAIASGVGVAVATCVGKCRKADVDSRPGYRDSRAVHKPISRRDRRDSKKTSIKNRIE